MQINDRKRSRLILIIMGILLLVGGLVQAASRVEAATTATTLYVDVNAGADNASCGSLTQPCASIQQAVNLASTGSTIRVAAGTYSYNSSVDPCGTFLSQVASVVCISNKELTIAGGYTASNWSTAYPEANRTVIDGGNSRRGIIIQHADGYPAATLTMSGFTVQNCRVQGTNSGPDYTISAFGGGMLADNSTITLRNMVFQNNQVVGGTTSSDYGGSASGGGVAIRTGVGTSVLESVTFINNRAIGGGGANRGGFGIGGGLYTYESTVHGQQITTERNESRGGNSNGSGLAGGENADGQGGGIAVQRGSTAYFEGVSSANNQTIGGNAPNGQGGGAFGGGIFAERATLTLVNAHLVSNIARGGDGRNASSGGSVALGGGLAADNTYTTLNRVQVIANRASGGNGTILTGSGGGGGGGFTRTVGDSVINITNSVFADNLAEMGSTGSVVGGGGGGMNLRGTSATITHSTIARNKLGSSPMQGNGILLLNDGAPTASVATIQYSIIAQHTEYTGAGGLHVKPGNSATLWTTIFDGNERNFVADGTITGLDAILPGPVLFRSPGYPNYDYHIEEDSAARNRAAGSTAQHDFDQDVRDSQPDVGADEYVAPRITGIFAISTSTNTVRVVWSTEGTGIERYEVLIFCPDGASRPNEVACGAPLDVGSVQEVIFTGLTNGVDYVIEVWAFTIDGEGVDSRSATFTVVDNFLFLPLTTGN